ncbi:hypothetical protein [Variovorax sp.]|uniref:hypothetical protein n=1 Tax=Variovorax sp. TaxID=1871043 RepID=UPI003BAD7928
MSVCVIIEMEGAQEWPETFSFTTIPAEKRPTALQHSRTAADQEAKRLASLNPGRRFVVLEAVAVGMQISVPTHVSIEGKTLISGMIPAVMALGDADDEIPF